MIQQQLKCDLCDINLKDSEKFMSKSLFNMSPQLKSKSSLTFVFDGFTRKGDLCFSCAKSVRDFIENKKAGHKY